MKSSSMLFPDKEWIPCTPEKQGFNPAILGKIERVMKKAEANGVLIRNGYLVAEWNYGGPSNTQFHTMSIGKSFTSLILGLALDDKLIPSLDTKVREIYPAFEAGPFTNQITFRHLATMTSGIKSSRHQLNYTKLSPPGTALIYHCDQCAHLARALTYLYGRTLCDVLKERILDPIGAQSQWDIDEPPWSPVATKDGRKVPVNTGYGCIYFTTSNLAKAGHLFLNYGKWKGKQLISSDYIKECWTEIPQKPLRPCHWGMGYGLYWWRLVPGVWHMSGWGGQFCMVWPEYNVVMVKLNATSEEHVRLEGKKYFEITKVYPHIYRSLIGKEFIIPLEWEVGWKARGTDNDWEISS